MYPQSRAQRSKEARDVIRNIDIQVTVRNRRLNIILNLSCLIHFKNPELVDSFKFLLLRELLFLVGKRDQT